MLRLLVVCFAVSLAGCSSDSAPAPTPAAGKSPAPAPAAKKGDKKMVME